MATNLGGASIVKVVQRGSFTMSGTQQDITITSVNTSKVELNFTFTLTNEGALINRIPTGKVLNSTTLRFNTDGEPGGAVIVAWELVEYFVVKSRQSGTTNSTVGTTNITITSVNTAKSKCIVSFRFVGITGGGIVGYDSKTATLTSATNLQVKQNTTSGTGVVIEWQVIEFI